MLYCVGQDHVVAFDFPTGSYLGMIADLRKLNGQAILLLKQSQPPFSAKVPSTGVIGFTRPVSRRCSPGHRDQLTMIVYMLALLAVSASGPSVTVPAGNAF
jgi:hypothetical protein